MAMSAFGPWRTSENTRAISLSGIERTYSGDTEMSASDRTPTKFASELSGLWVCLPPGLAFVAQQAWQVLANVPRPFAAFASLSRRDNASPNPRRPALARDKTWAFAWP